MLRQCGHPLRSTSSPVLGQQCTDESRVGGRGQRERKTTGKWKERKREKEKLKEELRARESCMVIE
jgi:hypothetical protein